MARICLVVLLILLTSRALALDASHAIGECSRSIFEVALNEKVFRLSSEAKVRLIKEAPPRGSSHRQWKVWLQLEMERPGNDGTMELVSVIERGIQHCEWIATGKTQSLSRPDPAFTWFFQGEFKKKCMVGIAGSPSNCERLSKDMARLTSPRVRPTLAHHIEDGNASLLEIDGGGIPIEDYVVQTPETDAVADQFYRASLDKMRRASVDPMRRNRGPNAEKTTASPDPWEILLQANGRSLADGLSPETAGIYFRVLSLLSNSSPNRNLILARILAKGDLRRYLRLGRVLLGEGSLIIQDSVYFDFRAGGAKLFGLVLPNPERGKYHAIQGAFQGCALREKGYSEREILDVVELTARLYETYSMPQYLGSRFLGEGVPAQKALWAPNGAEQIRRERKTVQDIYFTALKDIEQHIFGARFASSICAPHP